MAVVAAMKISLMSARQAALDEMSQRASKLGANAIIGVSFQYSTVGAQNGMRHDYMQWYSCSKFNYVVVR